MSESLFSPSWYRVANLRPQIRSHARFHRHRYRGQLWYVLQDHASGRAHRLSPAAYHLVGLMNGVRTLQEIWDATCTLLGDDAPTQDETIRLLGMLHAADVLRSDVTPDTEEILRRGQRRASAEWWQRYASPLSIRVPLFDPDAFLARHLRFARPFFTRTAAIVAGVVIAVAGVLAATHRSELAAGGSMDLLDPRNVVVLLILFPLAKVLHELGHAFAVKVWGGEVHEMGVLFLVFVPVPFVDASAASAFPEKERRMWVGAAGIAVDLVLASLALFLWLSVEPGLVRLIAYDVMWLCGVSSLFFNGNPLLRFDGYYVFADAIEIPNLAGRSRQYLAYLGMRYGLGLERVRNPVSAPGEAPWLVAYGVGSFFYRLAILFAIALFVAETYFVVGVLMALLSITLGVVVPLVRQIAFVFASSRTAERRVRAVATWGGGVAALVVLLVALPVPLMTRAQGVMWPPEGAHVRAGADGFVLRVLVSPDSEVRAGDPLVLTRDPTLEAELAVQRAVLRELRAQLHAEQRSDLVRAGMTREEIATAETQLARARERVGDVTIRSPGIGKFVAPRPLADLVGRYVHQGDLIGYVVGPAITTARVVLPQAQVALVRDRTRSVELRLVERVGEVLDGSIRRQVPAATYRLPSRALGTSGGGALPVDPADPDGLRTLERVFQLDIDLPQSGSVREIGGRVHVRFHHGYEPVAWRAFRALRRLFLRRLGV